MREYNGPGQPTGGLCRLIKSVPHWVRARVRLRRHPMKTTLFDTLGQDVRYGVRLLQKSPGFALVAVLSLGLGVGANSAIFQLLNAVRLRSLPISHPEELVEVKITDTKGGRTGSFRG